MSRSYNSRRGFKRGNWKCSCCHPKPVKTLEVVKAEDREGRMQNEDYRHENVRNLAFCDWDG